MPVQEQDKVPPQCCLCPVSGGALKPAEDDDLWCHAACMQWIPEVSVKDVARMEPVCHIKGIQKERWDLMCCICKYVTHSPFFAVSPLAMLDLPALAVPSSKATLYHIFRQQKSAGHLSYLISRRTATKSIAGCVPQKLSGSCHNSRAVPEITFPTHMDLHLHAGNFVTLDADAAAACWPTQHAM